MVQVAVVLSGIPDPCQLYKPGAACRYVKLTFAWPWDEGWASPMRGKCIFSGTARHFLSMLTLIPFASRLIQTLPKLQTHPFKQQFKSKCFLSPLWKTFACFCLEISDFFPTDRDFYIAFFKREHGNTGQISTDNALFQNDSKLASHLYSISSIIFRRVLSTVFTFIKKSI